MITAGVRGAGCRLGVELQCVRQAQAGEEGGQGVEAVGATTPIRRIVSSSRGSGPSRTSLFPPRSRARRTRSISSRLGRSVPRGVRRLDGREAGRSHCWPYRLIRDQVVHFLRASPSPEHEGLVASGDRRILGTMTKPAAAKRHLPTSPFKAPVAPPPKHFAVGDQVTHDMYGLGRVVGIEEGIAAVVDFGSAERRIPSPYSKMTKL